jgi:hypothetical protein
MGGREWVIATFTAHWLIRHWLTRLDRVAQVGDRWICPIGQ